MRTIMTNKDYAELDSKHCQIRVVPHISYEYTIDLINFIEEQEHYIELLTILRNASPNDVINIRMNNCGGYVDTAYQIIKEIQNSQGLVVGHADVNVASATTMIFLACDSWTVNPFTKFMIHAPTGS